MAFSDRVFQQSLSQLAGIGAGALPGPGGADISKASGYFNTLLGGDRTAIMRQSFPELNMMLDQAAGQQRNAARAGTARTGGGADVRAQTADATQKAFDTMVGTQQAGAADKLANIGSTELQTMMNALNIGGSLSQADVASRRAASAQMWSSLIGGAMSLGGGLLTKGLFGGGGGGGGGGGTVSPPSISTPPIAPPIAPNVTLGADPMLAEAMRTIQMNQNMQFGMQPIPRGY